MSRLSMLALTASLSFAAAFTSMSSFAEDNDKFDMVGLKLGMTPEEALTVLRAYGVNESTLDESRLVYTYSDGLKSFKTEDFIYRIVAAKDDREGGKRRTDNFNVFFSPPPQGGKLVAVQRTMENRIDPVTNGQFREAVLEKYGEAKANVPGALNWMFGGGTKNCVSNSLNGVGVPLPNPRPGKSESILDLVYTKSSNRYNLDRFRNPRVGSVEECANMLEYSIMSMNDRPATRVTATMIDVKSWVASELAAGEWVNGLTQDAIKKREGAGTKPSL